MALNCASWLGNAHAVMDSSAANASFLYDIAGDAGAGLAEKIYATIILSVSTIGFKPNFLSGERKLPCAVTEVTRRQEREIRDELRKLAGPFGAKERSKSAIEAWLDGLVDLEDWLHSVYAQADILPSAAGGNSVAGVIRSDMLWGLLLCSYVRLHLVRALTAALVASIPFRQIYGEDRSFPASRGAKSVAWSASSRYRSGILHRHFNTHPMASGARNFAPQISGWDELTGWLIRTARSRLREPLRTLPTRYTGNRAANQLSGGTSKLRSTSLPRPKRNSCSR